MYLNLGAETTLLYIIGCGGAIIRCDNIPILLNEIYPNR